MPHPSPSETAGSGRPSALEMFTDRVSEQALRSRLMVAHDEPTLPPASDFLAVFYAVGGVGKTTLCQKAVHYPETLRCADNLGIVLSKHPNRFIAMEFFRDLFNESDAAKDELSYNLACCDWIEDL
ncbi:hypothetical protein HQ447_11815 [bacterium]|nr:hypothetical protein [bacterium]